MAGIVARLGERTAGRRVPIRSFSEGGVAACCTIHRIVSWLPHGGCGAGELCEPHWKRRFIGGCGAAAIRSTLPCGRGGSGRSSSAVGNGAEPRSCATSLRLIRHEVETLEGTRGLLNIALLQRIHFYFRQVVIVYQNIHKEVLSAKRALDITVDLKASIDRASAVLYGNMRHPLVPITKSIVDLIAAARPDLNVHFSFAFTARTLEPTR